MAKREMLDEVWEKAREAHTRYKERKDLTAAATAAANYMKVLNTQPGNQYALTHLGALYSDLGQWGMGIALTSLANILYPDDPDIIQNLAVSYNRKGEFLKARSLYDAAIQIYRSRGDDGSVASALSNYATTFVGNGEAAGCVAAANEALKLVPDLENAQWTKALGLMEMGEYREGFALFRAGPRSVRCRAYSSQGNSVPKWEGQRGANVIVVGEQGIGDEILFATVLPDLMRDSKQVVLDCTRRLVGLFKSSFPDVVVCSTSPADMSVPYEGRIDYQVPMGDLLYHYRRDGFPPNPAPVIVPRADYVEQYRAKLASYGPGVKHVGVGWIGGTMETRLQARSIALEQWGPILKTPGIVFHSLQYTPDARDEVAKAVADFGARIEHDQEMIDDLERQAAFISCLDNSVLVTTAAVHLAGAMGKPCIVLAPFRSGWTFSQNTLPWYPQVKIVRGDDPVLTEYNGTEWDAAIAEAAALLAGGSVFAS